MYHEIRSNPKTTLDEFIHNNRQILIMYQYLIDSKVLSHEFPTSIDQVEEALRFDGKFSLEDVKEFLKFITNNETTMIQWHEPYPNVRTDNLYLAPRYTKAVVVGEYSDYNPTADHR